MKHSEANIYKKNTRYCCVWNWFSDLRLARCSSLWKQRQSVTNEIGLAPFPWSPTQICSPITNTRASSTQWQPAKCTHAMFNRSASLLLTIIQYLLHSLYKSMWGTAWTMGWGHAYLLRNTVNKGAAVCTVRLTARACQGTHRSFCTFIKNTQTFGMTWMTAWPKEKQSSVATLTRHWHSLSPLQRVFSSVFTSQHSCVSFQLRMRQKNTARRSFWGRLSRSNNVDCDR